MISANFYTPVGSPSSHSQTLVGSDDRPNTAASERSPNLSPAQASSNVDHDLGLLARGNDLFLSHPNDVKQAISHWLVGGAGGPATRSVMADRVNVFTNFTHPSERDNPTLDLFHWAWLTPNDCAGVSAFWDVLLQDRKFEQVMVQMLEMSVGPNLDGGLATQLHSRFAPMVGNLFVAQNKLATCMYHGDFASALLVAASIQRQAPQLAVPYWVDFLCALELRGGVASLSEETTENFNNVAWARKLVESVQGWDAHQHTLAQGGFSESFYRWLWELVLIRYARLPTDDFQTPPALVHAAARPGTDPRCLHGLLWKDLVALPFPQRWAAHAATLAADYAQVPSWPGAHPG